MEAFGAFDLSYSVVLTVADEEKEDDRGEFNVVESLPLDRFR